MDFQYLKAFQLQQPELIDWDFYEPYTKIEPPFGEIGLFVYIRTYSRFINELGRREKWCETVLRVVEFSLSLDAVSSKEDKVAEAKELFDAIFNMRVFPAGRTLWAGDKNKNLDNTSQFNCSAVNVDSFSSFVEAAYMLFVGAGVGYSVEEKNISNLPLLFPDYHKISFEPYEYSHDKVEETYLVVNNSKFVIPNEWITWNDKDFSEAIDDLIEAATKIAAFTEVTVVVGDSREAWCVALKYFFKCMEESATNYSLVFNFNNIRPMGSPIKTFGGRASGFLPLQTAIQKIYWRIKSVEGAINLNPVVCMDIMCMIAEMVVVAGVRRSSEISLGDSNNEEFITAKDHLWDYKPLINAPGDITKDDFPLEFQDILYQEGVQDVEEKGLLPLLAERYDIWEDNYYAELVDRLDPKFRYRSVRVMSNNSIILKEKPNISLLEKTVDSMQKLGEPGVWNVDTVIRRTGDRERIITNPCGEILLRHRSVCNLVDTVVPRHLNADGTVNKPLLHRSIRLGTRMCSRITQVTMWHPEWDRIQKEDRLLGVSLTGTCDAFNSSCPSTNWKEVLQELHTSVRQEADSYHEFLGIPRSILTTTSKPSGSLSLLPGVSAGAHQPYAPYFIRNVRISSLDPLAKAARDMGLIINPENAQGKDLDKAETWVISFGCKTTATKKSVDEPLLEQLERYKMLMDNYVEHNVSYTATVGEDEWKLLPQWFLDNWGSFIGISFLPKFDCSVGDEGAYPQLPFVACTEHRYEELKSLTPVLKEEELLSLLTQYETSYEDLGVDSDCSSKGFCPVR